MGEDLLPFLRGQEQFDFGLEVAVVLVPLDAAVPIQELDDQFLDVNRRLIDPILQPPLDDRPSLGHGQHAGDVGGGFVVPLFGVEPLDDLVVGALESLGTQFLDQLLLGLQAGQPLGGLSHVAITLRQLSGGLRLGGADGDGSGCVLSHG